MAKRSDIEQALADLLRPEAFRDYGPNGLQVEGRSEVKRLVSGVTASLAFIDAAIEAGADDVLTNDDGSIEVITPPNDYMTVKEALEAAGFTSEFGQVTMKAENETELTGEDAVRMQKLIDALEGLDDVQDVYTSVVLEE